MSLGPATLGRPSTESKMNSSTFLTHEELKELTGYTMKSKQKAWLDEHGIPCIVNANGAPKVYRPVLEQLMGLSPHQNEGLCPDFTSLMKRTLI